MLNRASADIWARHHEVRAMVIVIGLDGPWAAPRA
jgi:hypothetical protein